MEWIKNLNSGTIVTIALIIIGLLTAWFIIREIKRKVTRSINKAKSLINNIQMATEETAHTPRTISGAEGLYVERIKRDFPEFNFDIAKQTALSVLTSYFNVLNTDVSDESMERSCTRSFINELEVRKQMEDILYDKFNVHKIAISDYRKSNEEAVITYQAALEYQLPGKMLAQYVYTVSYVYYLAYGAEGENVSLRCENCGAPIDTLGDKICPYCGAEIKSSVERTWKVNKIQKYR